MKDRKAIKETKIDDAIRDAERLADPCSRVTGTLIPVRLMRDKKTKLRGTAE